jgi:hypothetical protein
MAEPVRFEWSVTIMEDRLCVFESDVRVTAAVNDDGEVKITNLEMMGRVPRRNPHSVFLMDQVIIPMHDSQNPHMVRLANWAKEILEADDGFIDKAHEEAGLVYEGLGGNDPDGRMKWVMA